MGTTNMASLLLILWKLASNSLRTSPERLVRYLGFLSDEDVMELEETKEGLRLTLVLSQRNRKEDTSMTEIA